MFSRPLQRAAKRRDGRRQFPAMIRIDRPRCRRQLAEHRSEQTIVEMQVDRLAGVFVAGTLQGERDAGRIEMRLEA